MAVINTMKVRVDFTWYRNHFNKDTVTNWVVLEDVEKSKKGVTQAIRDYAKTWTGKGFLEISSIESTYAYDQKFCEIAQKKFCFNN